jgi:hypothetical protein
MSANRTDASISRPLTGNRAPHRRTRHPQSTARTSGSPPASGSGTRLASDERYSDLAGRTLFRSRGVWAPFAAVIVDGASRARTGDLLGAITPHTRWLVLVRLAPAPSGAIRSPRFSQFGSTLVARNYRLSDARRERDNDSTSRRAAARTRRRPRRCAFDAVGQALGARSCPSWRSSIRRILPVSVFGRSLTNSISRG